MGGSFEQRLKQDVIVLREAEIWSVSMLYDGVLSPAGG